MSAEENPRPGKRKKADWLSDLFPRVQAEPDEFDKYIRQEEAKTSEQLLRDLGMLPKPTKKTGKKDEGSKNISKEMEELEALERLELEGLRHEMIELKKVEIERRLEENRLALERLKKRRAA